MRTRWIIAAVCVAGRTRLDRPGNGPAQGLRVHGRRHDLGDRRCRSRRARRRHRLDRVQGPPPGLSQAGPGRFVEPGRDRVAVADERQAQQPRVGEEPPHDAGLVERQVGRDPRRGTGARSGRAAPRRPSRWVNRCSSPAAIAALLQVDVVDDDPPLPEEPERGARRGRVVAAEDLDVGHLAGRRLAERRGHGRSVLRGRTTGYHRQTRCR